MKKICSKDKGRIQLIAVLTASGLFLLIFFLSRLTMPGQIPSDYYADDGVYVVRDTSLRAWILLFVILLCITELAVVFRAGLAKAAGKIAQTAKRWGKELLIAAAFGAAGALAARAVLAVAGKEYSEFWLIAGALLFVAFEIQLRFLFKKKPGEQPSLKATDESKTGVSVLFFIVMAVLTGLILFMSADRLANAPKYIRSWHFVFPVAILLAETVLAGMLYRKYVLLVPEKEIPYQRVFLLVVFFLAIGYMLIFLPYVSPDEDAHYLSAYRLSDLFLGRICRYGDARLMMRTEDYLFYSGAQLTNNAQYYAQITGQTTFFMKEPGLVVTEATMVTNALPAYLPAAAGMTVARLLRLSGTWLFYFGRLGNIVFCTAVMSWVMKKAGKKEAAFFALLTFPMMLHLLGSCSYDAVIFAFCALFLVQLVRIFSMKGEAPKRELGLLVLFGVLMAPCKLVYLPLLFTVLFLPYGRFGTRKKAALWKIAVIACGLLSVAVVTKGASWLAASGGVKSLAAEGGTGRILSWCQEEGYTLTLLLSDLPSAIRICIHTAIHAFDEYFFTMLGSRLGWLDILVPTACLVVSFVLFLLSVQIRDEETEELSFGKKSWTVLCCLASAAAILFAMLLSWTPLSYDTVAGVQGRYFLPLLIPFIWFSVGKTLKVGAGFRKILIFAEGIINIWILAYVYVHTVLAG